jgi:hypothetical protein
METTIRLITELRKRGFEESTSHCKGHFTKVDEEINIVIDSANSVRNVTLSKGTDKNARLVFFTDVRSNEDVEEILSFL